MTLSSRKKRQTTARTTRPSTGLIDSVRFNAVPPFALARRRPVLVRLGNWVSSALLLTTLPLSLALPLSSAVAQVPQSTATPNTAAPATWIPPVHVAPQRGEVGPSASNAIKLSDQYPGIFEPEPVPTRVAPNEAYPNERTTAQSRTSPRQNSATAMRGQGSAPARGSSAGPRLRNGGPTATAMQSPRSIQPVNRQVNYQQTMDQYAQPADSSPRSEVQPAFVADGYQLPPNSVPQRKASPARSGRGEFTGTRAPAVRDAGLNAEYAELEQPLGNFAQTPADQPNGATQAESRQIESRDASVLDQEPALPSWQSSDLSRGVPARPASMPRNIAPAESPELPGEPVAGDWNPNMPPPAGVMSSPESIPDSIDPDSLQDIDTLPRPQKTLSCDELRKKLLSEPLTDIALDVSPQLPERGALPSKPSGDWVDHNGNLLARGQMVALSRGYVIVDTAEGRRKISVARLGDASLAMVASAWQLPGECAIGQGEFAGRCWTPQLSTWYASNLCHKPLYFENVQLERYGHSAGPFMGPIRSSAHFFGSLAFWPYHTAINPPNECIYTLGHYRPGNCAPWLVDPFPFSARGMIRQGAVVTGAAFLF